MIIPERKPTLPVYAAYQAPPYSPTAPMAAPPDPHQTPIGLTTPPYGQATVEQIVNRGDLTPDQMVNLIRGMSLTSATTQPGHANPMGAAPMPHATQPAGALCPNPLTSSSSSVTLPPFYGNEGEFGEWWQYFIQMVDRNPALLPIEKLRMLKESLRGKTKFLAQRTYLEDRSLRLPQGEDMDSLRGFSVNGGDAQTTPYAMGDHQAEQFPITS